MIQLTLQTRQLILRKTGIVFVIFVCSIFCVQLRGQKNAIVSNEDVDTADSFYFLSGEPRDPDLVVEQPGLGHIQPNIRNPLIGRAALAAASNTDADHDSLLRSSLRLRQRLRRSVAPDAPLPNCTPPAYKEFPPDLFGQWLRERGFIIVHILVVCYMFFCLAVVCDRHFLPSLELCAQTLGLSNDVAGATFMAAGSSAPELFTAILGVFIAKSDVGTGTIVGSAVFNILFVIGLCAVYSASIQLNWWPVARDSTYYSLTVLVLIFVAYDGRISTFESALMLILYGGYILTMQFNEHLHLWTVAIMERYSVPIPTAHGSQPGDYRSQQEQEYRMPSVANQLPPSKDPYKMSLLQAAHHVIIQHKRLFRAKMRFKSAAELILIRNRKMRTSDHQQQQQDLRRNMLSQMRPPSMSTEQLEEYWRTPPNYHVQGLYVYIKWLLIAPLYAILHFTIPDCRQKPQLFLVSFSVSVFWIAIFSYIMVWMVTIIGFTFGIPDSIMGITLLAAGTSVPDAYASLHVASQGQGDMAVSNSIGSNVFDILVGLALPWFVETAIIYPGTVASINSRGLFYAIVLLFISLLATIGLFHHHNWTLNPRLGTTLLISYAVFLFVCSILEFNVIDVKNPGLCED